MPKLARTFTSAAFAVFLAVAAVGVQPLPVAAADITVGAAELEAVRLLNVERGKAGLYALRVDTRLMAMARQRSTDMASRSYFSHVSPDGKGVFDMIAASGLTWYGAGEIIAWNTWPTLADSTIAAKDGWMASPSHKAIVMSSTFNYVGLGLAVDATGKKLWTGVFIQGPDRTGAYVRLAPLPNYTLTASESYEMITVSWSGADIRLQTLTAGLRHYQVQVRTNGGAWVWWSTATTSTSRAVKVWRSKNYDLRIRACDKVGNCGAWKNQHLDI